jgi:hypothetical protein
MDTADMTGESKLSSSCLVPNTLDIVVLTAWDAPTPLAETQVLEVVLVQTAVIQEVLPIRTEMDRSETPKFEPKMENTDCPVCTAFEWACEIRGASYEKTGEAVPTRVPTVRNMFI